MCVINHRKLENTDNYNWWSRALLPPLIRGCYWELQPVCTSASNNPWGFTMHDVIDCLAFENHTHLCSVSIGPHHSGWRGLALCLSRNLVLILTRLQSVWGSVMPVQKTSLLYGLHLIVSCATVTEF